MWGEPPDVEGECNARLYVGDTHGDNHATMRCQLAPGHEGLHREQYSEEHTVTVTWKGDGSLRKCDQCEKGFRSIESYDPYCSEECEKKAEEEQEREWEEYKKENPDKYPDGVG